MPSGYTSRISEDMSFKEFALLCARAFSACVTMREEPLDKPIPDKMESSNYHMNSLDKAQDDLTKLEAISIDIAEDEARDEYHNSLSVYNQQITDKKELETKYINMLARVNEWIPPASKHEGLKSFMIEQITDSIDYDCSTEYDNPPVLLSGEEWLRDKIKETRSTISYHIKHKEKEQITIDGRNLWLKQLRDSLS